MAENTKKPENTAKPKASEYNKEWARTKARTLTLEQVWSILSAHNVPLHEDAQNAMIALARPGTWADRWVFIKQLFRKFRKGGLVNGNESL